MIRITALSTTVATTALIALSLMAGPASAQQKGGVQIAGNATVIGLYYLAFFGANKIVGQIGAHGDRVG